MEDYKRQVHQCGPFANEREAKFWICGVEHGNPDDCTDYGVIEIDGQWYACYTLIIEIRYPDEHDQYEDVVRFTSPI
jgi:hypothetical protein